MLEALTEARDCAQIELASAEIVLLEASAAAGTLREEASRLEAAVAALCGELPVEPPSAALTKPLSELPPNDPTYQERLDAANLSPEEFDAERKRKQRIAKKKQREEELANNPLANVRCPGCGCTGTMQESLIQAPSGATVRMMVCYKCNNQIMI